MEPDRTERHRDRRQTRNGGTSAAGATTTTVFALNSVAALDGCDAQLLPSSFRALEQDLKFSPSDLGGFALCQSVAGALCSPLWGYLADRHSRKLFLAFGCALWGVVTVLLAHASSYEYILGLRAVNGAALASVGPISQSILADVKAADGTGQAFGWMNFALSVGRMVGGFGATSLSEATLFGTQGWRVVFAFVGYVSIGMAVFVMMYVDEIPRASHRGKKAPAGKIASTEADVYVALPGHDASRTQTTQSEWSWAGLGEALRLSTVWILTVQGLFGAIPGSAFAFLTMYYQYCGVSNAGAALIVSAANIGAMLAGPFAGRVSDRVFKRSPDHGRVWLAQLSLLLKAINMPIILVVLPRHPDSFPWFLLSSLVSGMLAGWLGDRPMLAEVTPPHYRATVFATVTCVEQIAGSLLGAPLVGLLAEKHWGYKPSTDSIPNMPEDLRLANANALAQALFWLTVGPFILNFVVYGLLHFTLPGDRRSAKERLAKETETENTRNVTDVPPDVRVAVVSEQDKRAGA